MLTLYHRHSPEVEIRVHVGEKMPLPPLPWVSGTIDGKLIRQTLKTRVGFRLHLSVDLLSKGVSLENVSKALGHSSAKITEKFYGACVKSRQEALDSEIRMTWCSVN